jgi:hypothetical protein
MTSVEGSERVGSDCGERLRGRKRDAGYSRDMVAQTGAIRADFRARSRLRRDAAKGLSVHRPLRAAVGGTVGATRPLAGADKSNIQLRGAKPRWLTPFATICRPKRASDHTLISLAPSSGRWHPPCHSDVKSWYRSFHHFTS